MNGGAGYKTYTKHVGFQTTIFVASILARFSVDASSLRISIEFSTKSVLNNLTTFIMLHHVFGRISIIFNLLAIHTLFRHN